MKTVYLGLAAVFLTSSANAATIVNAGTEPMMVTVTEGADRSEVEIAPAESMDFCLSGCFVTLPNGDRHVLKGTETLELREAGATIK